MLNCSYFEGRTKIEPIAIVILSVVMSLASVQMIRESVQQIIHFATADDTGPVFKIPSIVICSATVGQCLIFNKRLSLGPYCR